MNGLLADPIFAALRSVCPSPVSVISPITPPWTPVTSSDLTWNFNQFLLDRTGVPVRRYDDGVLPQAIYSDIMTLLAQ